MSMMKKQTTLVKNDALKSFTIKNYGKGKKEE